MAGASWEEDLAELNRMAGTALAIKDFQGIYGAEEHENWVRRVLVWQAVCPVRDVEWALAYAPLESKDRP